MKKYILPFLTLVFIIFNTSTSFANTSFSDVTEKINSYKEIQYLLDNNYIQMTTDNKFGVNEKATRADIAMLITSTLQLELPTNITESPFNDVAIDDSRLPYFLAVANNKLMSGNADGQFMPDQMLTRAQLATILVKAFKLKGATKLTFQDVPAKHSAFSAISILVANEITSGFENNLFKPQASVTKGQLAVFIARILEPSFRKPLQEVKSCVKHSAKSKYYINVSVANLWKNYNIDRSIDAPSMSMPVNYDKWVPSMNLQQKKWLVDRTDTQALYNDEVKLLKSKSDMHYVAAKDQFVPYNSNGYPGWVGKNQIVKSNLDTSDCEIAIVASKKATLLHENKKAFLQISYATILPVIKKENGYYYVQTASNGVKLLKTTDAKLYKNYEAVPKPSKTDIVNTAKRFLGLKYLWAGTSSWGYDCSGIIYAAYRAHGIMIPRDSFYQATKGKKISKSKLQPGDLVFFAYNGGKDKVYHVGLYVGNGQMLHAPHYASQVKIEKLDSGVYKRNYAGARRYL